ncbi:Glutathione S-transferase P [Balamuthia mandrillaris]
MSVEKPTLSYFNVPGRAEVPRLLLELAGVDYEWVGFSFKGSAGGDWAEYKSKHGEELAFGQVPRYQEPEGLDLVQSNAIARYLAKKHGFNGANETEAALIDQFNEGVVDFGSTGIKAIFAPEASKAELLAKFLSEDLPKWLGHFERAFAKNGTGFFVGDKVSYADVHLFVSLDLVFRLEGAREVFEGFSHVKAAYEKVASLPKIKAFYDSKPYGN